MQHIEFRTIHQELGAGAVVDVVVPHVGGVPLPDLPRPVERPPASREGQPDLAGSCAGLDDDRVRWPSRHYLGEPVLTWIGDGDAMLLGCGTATPPRPGG